MLETEYAIDSNLNMAAPMPPPSMIANAMLHTYNVVRYSSLTIKNVLVIRRKKYLAYAGDNMALKSW